MKEDVACSDYILELLEYVQTDLLRVDRVKRADIKDIVNKFAQLHRYCEQTDDYCILRNKPASRTNSDMESVKVPGPPDTDIAAGNRIPRSGTWPSYVRRSSSGRTPHNLSGPANPERIHSQSILEQNNTDDIEPSETKVASNVTAEKDIPAAANNVPADWGVIDTQSPVAKVSADLEPDLPTENATNGRIDRIVENDHHGFHVADVSNPHTVHTAASSIPTALGSNLADSTQALLTPEEPSNTASMEGANREPVHMSSVVTRHQTSAPKPKTMSTQWDSARKRCRKCIDKILDLCLPADEGG